MLTQSQVRAIKNFGEATQGYEGLPGTVLRNYEEVRKARVRLSFVGEKTDTAESARDAWDHLVREQVRRDATIEAAEQLDDALGILGEYAKLLALLASDDYTEALTKSAVDLGNDVDKAVKLYNEKYGAKLDLVGSWVAGAIRGIGGLCIRSEQAMFLKRVVGEAKAPVDDLTTQVSALLDKVEQGLADLTLESGGTGSLASQFRRAAERQTKLTLDLVDAGFDGLEKAEGAKSTITSARKATKSYKAAHDKLVEITRSKRVLADRLNAPLFRRSRGSLIRNGKNQRPAPPDRPSAGLDHSWSGSRSFSDRNSRALNTTSSRFARSLFLKRVVDCQTPSASL